MNLWLIYLIVLVIDSREHLRPVHEIITINMFEISLEIIHISIGNQLYGFEFNLELICTSKEIARAASASAISAFRKTHKCKFIPNSTRKTV